MKASPEMIRESLERLAVAYQSYSLLGLRWDYLCNIHDDSRDLIREELKRRGVSMAAFDTLGRGRIEK